MSTDYRALCAELLSLAEESTSYFCMVDSAVKSIDRARTALAQPEPEGVTDEGLIAAYNSGLEGFTYKPKPKSMTSREWIHLEGLRAVLTRYARPTIEPVPVAERPWEREKGWRDLDGECWWCPPDGPAYWQMANPAMVYGGWLLPAHALPFPDAEDGQP